MKIYHKGTKFNVMINITPQNNQIFNNKNIKGRKKTQL